MKYSPRFYAKALTKALAEEGEEKSAALVKNLSALVKKNGDEAQFKKILTEFIGQLEVAGKIRTLTVASARLLTGSMAKLIETIVKPGDLLKKTIEPRMVAGLKVTINNERQFDGSLKGKIDKLFIS
ncbi:MAG TPA: F0F1 ATP synthase subunit delta [Candidatus Tyrphobacter sp.]|nr:F0F1 ATP synthase subunit delta [Candidatus Tyrphobacter sp.]